MPMIGNARQYAGNLRVGTARPGKRKPHARITPDSTPESALILDRPEGEPRAGLLALARAHSPARHAAASATLRPTKAVGVVAT